MTREKISIYCKKDLLTSCRYYEKGKYYKYRYCPEVYSPHLVSSDGNGDCFNEEKFNKHFCKTPPKGKE